MKRILAALLAVAVLLTGAVVSAVPAAQASTTNVQNSSGDCNYIPALPTDVSGCKFWTGTTICVDGSGINGAYYRVATIAQAWNNAVGSPNVFALDYSNDCVADGYPPSRRFTIGGYYGGNDGYCVNQTLSSRTVGTSNFDWWTNGAPGLYVNFDNACLNSQSKRDHVISAIIGSAMGLSYLRSSGWSSRVMYLDGPVTMPDAASGLTLYRIYSGYYG